MTEDRVLEIVRDVLSRNADATEALGDDWEAVQYDRYAAYHALLVLRDPEYLAFVTDKLQKYVSSDARRFESAMDADTAEALTAACDREDVVSVVRAVMTLSLRQMEIVGI